MILFDTVESGILLLSSLWGQQWKWTEFRQMGPEGMRQGKERFKKKKMTGEPQRKQRMRPEWRKGLRQKYVKFRGERWVTIREKPWEIKSVMLEWERSDGWLNSVWKAPPLPYLSDVGFGGWSESRLFLEHPKTENQTSAPIFGSVDQNGGVKVWQDLNSSFKTSCFILWTFVMFRTVWTHGHKMMNTLVDALYLS